MSETTEVFPREIVERAGEAWKKCEPVYEAFFESAIDNDLDFYEMMALLMSIILEIVTVRFKRPHRIIQFMNHVAVGMVVSTHHFLGVGRDEEEEAEDNNQF